VASRCCGEGKEAQIFRISSVQNLWVCGFKMLWKEAQVFRISSVQNPLVCGFKVLGKGEGSSSFSDKLGAESMGLWLQDVVERGRKLALLGQRLRQASLKAGRDSSFW
jgi:hypothetical protein